MSSGDQFPYKNTFFYPFTFLTLLVGWVAMLLRGYFPLLFHAIGSSEAEASAKCLRASKNFFFFTLLFALLFFLWERHYGRSNLSKMKKNSPTELFRANSLLILSILEAIYIIYMFLFFKTTYNFNPIDAKNYLADYLKHNNQISKSLRICHFGRDAIFALIFLLLARNIPPFPRSASIPAIAMAIFLGECMNNRNVGVYLFPLFLLECLLFFIEQKRKIFFEKRR